MLDDETERELQIFNAIRIKGISIISSLEVDFAMVWLFRADVRPL